MKRKKWIFLIVLTMTFLLVGNAFAFKASWDASTGNVDGYRIYYSPILDNVLDRTAPFADVSADRTSACINSGFNEYSINGFYVGATAYNEAGESGLSNIVYHLYGNIHGNNWDGVSHLDARVDGLDLNIIGFYFNQSVTHQEIDCSSVLKLEDNPLKEINFDLVKISHFKDFVAFLENVLF